VARAFLLERGRCAAHSMVGGQIAAFQSRYRSRNQSKNRLSTGGAIRNKLGNLCLRETAWWGWEIYDNCDLRMIWPSGAAHFATLNVKGDFQYPPHTGTAWQTTVTTTTLKLVSASCARGRAVIVTLEVAQFALRPCAICTTPLAQFALGRVLINSPCPLYPPKADITAAQTNVRFVP
jgi:hypothetical protein